MDEPTLIRCPFTRLEEDRTIYCKQSIVKVYLGSRGLAWCRHCKKEFYFEVGSQNNSKRRVVVQRENSK